MSLNEEKNRYSDIIDMPHHVSVSHPRLPMSSRAAQFSPFAALTGYDNVIHNTAAEEESIVLGSEHGEVFCEDP